MLKGFTYFIYNMQITWISKLSQKFKNEIYIFLHIIVTYLISNNKISISISTMHDNIYIFDDFMILSNTKVSSVNYKLFKLSNPRIIIYIIVFSWLYINI